MIEYMKVVLYLGAVCFGGLLGLIMIWSDRR